MRLGWNGRTRATRFQRDSLVESLVPAYALPQIQVGSKRGDNVAIGAMMDAGLLRVIKRREARFDVHLAL